MSMGSRKSESQGQMFIALSDLPAVAGHPFYEKLNQALKALEFDRQIEGQCRKFYDVSVGRKSIPPGVYFRMLLIGYGDRFRARHCLAGDRFAVAAVVSG